MSDREEVIRFAFFMARNSKLEVNEVFELLTLAKVHRRIETELTNGYKGRDGNEDVEAKKRQTAKREKIDARMEQICKVSYGALTVSVVVDGREVYIP